MSKRVAVFFAGLLLVSGVAACAPVPATVETPMPAVTTAQGAATATAAPTAAPATPTPTMPDPKTDPQGALSYASAGEAFKSAEFTYAMAMTIAPADDASKEALGEQAAQLEDFKLDVEGTGAMDISDAEAGKVRMRVDMDMSAAGQQMSLQMVMIDQTAWVKMAGQEEWTKVEGDQVRTALPTGTTPDQMLKDFENAVDVEWVEDVTLNGEEVSHLRFTMDPAKMDLETLMGSVTQGQELSADELQDMMKDMKPVVDVWLTKVGLELRAQKTELDWIMALPEEANPGNARLRFVMSMDAQYSRVNEPVTIEAPAE